MEKFEKFVGHESAAAGIYQSSAKEWGLRSYYTNVIQIKNNVLTVHNNTSGQHSNTTMRHIGWFVQKYGERYAISVAIIKDLYRNGEALNLKTGKRRKIRKNA